MKSLWCFRIQTDDHLLEIRPTSIVSEKKETSCCMTHLLCPSDTRVQKKEQEKMEHYILIQKFSEGSRAVETVTRKFKLRGLQACSETLSKPLRYSQGKKKFFLFSSSVTFDSFVSFPCFCLFCFVFWSVYNIVVVLTRHQYSNELPHFECRKSLCSSCSREIHNTDKRRHPHIDLQSQRGNNKRNVEKRWRLNNRESNYRYTITSTSYYWSCGKGQW